MGTRGFFGVYVDGKLKGSYNHMDSYPTGLGRDLVGDLRATNIGELRQLARKCKLVKSSSKPKKVPAGLQIGEDWYTTLRDFQGQLLQLLRLGVMTNDTNFPKDSLFCEWAYVVDLDREMFDVYRGFQHSAPTDGMWAGGRRHKETGYYPCQRVGIYPLKTVMDPTSDAEQWVCDLERQGEE